MAAQIIPLTPSPNQTFQSSLAIDGKTITLNFALHYNEMANYWVLRISDALGAVLIDSVPLITGDWPAANILQQQGYMGIGSAYILNASQVPSDYPNAQNLGTDFVLLWSDTPIP